ncbi:MAG TPA: redox-regulated ATPase YchF [Candidatus Ozemobacteraceae bacterium]|nr:redox-regulated ATPase YchF [Candidatus Ozemobacteraceae bacterium]
MKIGLAGLPMSGKTTVFNLCTRLQAQTRDYLAQSEEVNTGVIKVPDERIDHLVSVYKPKSTVYATVEFVDIPGVSKGDAGLSSKTLANIRVCESLGLVVRLFDSDDVPHIRNRVDPASDIDELRLEFIFSDLGIVQNKIERLQREMKGTKKPIQIKEMELMEKCKTALEANRFLSELTFDTDEEALLKGFRFLTQKPLLVIGNCSDAQLKNAAHPVVVAFQKACADGKLSSMLISAKTEMEISSLSPEEEATFLQEYGITESGRSRLIKQAYGILNYISFLTAGEDECRAWPIQRGTIALKAAGKIHSDIERGFIRAEVVAFDDFVAHKGMAGAKAAGLIRLEGKEYPVADGDIINFRFNVG